ncbi:molybdopterin-dependent oxidoreductase [Smaragdicoccus niigatensis]|uniref:molybdopterin-dependent oxidoreductase n=1 Tax=Smaragdicoccus niigatensis TaxID=359359 RepID=UPI00037CB4E7|nr:molybdopterin-dependent oxidoreductase [Smaragdicoccus niigatensis]
MDLPGPLQSLAASAEPLVLRARRSAETLAGLDSDPVPAGYTGTRLGVCNLCEAICGLEFTFENGNVKSVRGNAEDPLSRGHICPKGVALVDVYNDPDRLRRPVRRVGSGAHARWVEISWDEAFDRVAEGLAGVSNTHGRNSVGVYLGNPSVHSLGAATHGIEMLRVLRSRNRFSATSVDQLPHQFVAWQLYGHQLLIPVPDIDRTNYLLVFGANPMASNGSLWTVPDFPGRLRELRQRGGKMVVFDPRRTETAKAATEHHFVRPGTDALVLLAMLNVLFTEGLTRPARYVRGIKRVQTLVADFTPEFAERMSGVRADVIRQVTREFAESDAAVAYGRIGVSTQSFGSLCQWAIQCLNILTGNLDRPGGAMFPEPAIDVVKRGLLGRGHFGKYTSRVRKLPEFAGELPVAAMAEEIDTPGDGQIRALFTVSGNPVSSTPDGRRLDDALSQLDFMASVDIYINETTRHADVILPPTTALERDQYDLAFHVFGTRNTARFTPAMFGKEPGTMHDWEIFRDLGVRLEKRMATRMPLKQRLIWEARLRISPSVLIAALLAAGRRTSMRALRDTPQGVDLGPLQPTLPKRLMTKGQTITLAQPLITDDLTRLRETFAEAAPDGLMLIGRRHQRDCNSWLHNTDRLTRGQARHRLLMNPGDLAARGLSDGQQVQVSSRVGSVVIEVSATDDMMPGVVSLPHGYGHQGEGIRLSRAGKLPGVSINDLTDPARVDLSGNAALSAVPVQVVAV